MSKSVFDDLVCPDVDLSSQPSTQTGRASRRGSAPNFPTEDAQLMPPPRERRRKKRKNAEAKGGKCTLSRRISMRFSLTSSLTERFVTKWMREEQIVHLEDALANTAGTPDAPPHNLG